MDTVRPQRTLASSAAVEGFGYWSGRDVRVEFHPAAADTGIVFVRTDLAGAPRIPARVENRVEIPLRTALRVGHASVEMIEHVMAALAGLGIDNCEVAVDAAEMPGFDGSAADFVAALDAAGLVVQTAVRRRCTVGRSLRCSHQGNWIEARPSRQGRTVLAYYLDYGPGPIGRQRFQIALTPESFRRELACCRTFLLEEQADWLRARGLGLRAGYGDLLVFGPEGPIDNTLRFPDECVRHKMLDMVGDLALAGCDLIGCFTACRSGHRLNAQLVRALASAGAYRQPLRRCA